MRVEGTLGPLEERLRAISKHMMDERPLRRETERVTGVLALQPGVQITATVQPPTTTDGASELVLNVKRQPYTIGTGMEYRSGVRAVITGTVNSLTPLGEQITVSTLQPRGSNHETFYSATPGAQPIGTDGLLAKLSWSHYRGMLENLAAGAARLPIALPDRYAAPGPVVELSAVALQHAQPDRHRHLLRQRRQGSNTRPSTRRSHRPSWPPRWCVLGAEALYTQRKPARWRRASFGFVPVLDAAGASKSANNNVDSACARASPRSRHDLPFGLVRRSRAAQRRRVRRCRRPSRSAWWALLRPGLLRLAKRPAIMLGLLELNRLFTASMTYLKTVQP